MDKISVIIPIYNGERFLSEALDSVINQTHKNLEIICVNDGSTDNSLDIINSYAQKDKRIKVIDKSNSGYGATVNLGIAATEGNYIAIFEPDDILHPNIYEKLLKEAIDNDLDVVKCNFNNYWSKNNKRKRSGLIAKTAKSTVFSPKDNLKIFTCHASVWAGIYKKDFLITNNIKFLETPGASYQDMSFTFKVLASCKKIKLLKEPLLDYRQDNPMSSINNAGKIFCVCDEYEELTNFLNSNIELKKIFNTQKLINQYRAYLWNLKRLNPKFQKTFLEKFSSTFLNFYHNKEINNDFYKSINKKDFYLLINKPNLFIEKVINKNFFYWLKH